MPIHHESTKTNIPSRRDRQERHAWISCFSWLIRQVPGEEASEWGASTLGGKITPVKLLPAARVRLLAPAVALILAATSVACNRPPDDPKDYVARIAAARAAKDADFQRDDDPIPPARKAEFLPLAYFPIDPDYNVLAALTPATERIEVMMPTSSGQLRKMLQIGRLEFTLKGQPMSLLAFTEGDISRLFVPFSDMTSGTETYAAGRFLDLTRTATSLYELDFNRAYIPYCYYNAAFECPYPPPENRLKIPIHAGERMKKSDGA
jgi:uncharacterized protein (DUF1684 family)